ncbi:MAG: class I SAM-dependent methyltransferase [Janthinobacterium lividum]
MAIASTFNARDPAVYERSMGRWSRRLAAGFVAFAGLAAGDAVLDVGCGTGSLLHHLSTCPEAPVLTGIDASPLYLAAARARHPDWTVLEGDACAIPFPNSTFDRVLSQLVLQFIPNAGDAVREMVRVARPGGVVAAAVWASGGGMVAQRIFLDTAALLDPAADRLRAHTFTRPLTSPGELAALWDEVGLTDIREEAVTIFMNFAEFADWWDPIASGEGTLGRYVSALGAVQRTLLEKHLRSAYTSGAADGPRSFAATASVCRGIKGQVVRRPTLTAEPNASS